MLIARYRDPGGSHLGLVEDGHVLEIAADAARIDVLGVLAATDLRSPQLLPVGPKAISDIQLLAPIAKPGKVICVGANYAAHAQESGMAVPDFPNVFAKFPSSLLDPGRDIELPDADPAVDYEGELCVVIGRQTRHIPKAGALACVAGYTVANDVSARTLQGRVSQWVVGKSCDTFCPLGPWLATADSIPDPGALRIQTLVDNEIMQDASTGDMVFDVATLIAYLSAVMTLEAGDIILTGTPDGVGAMRTPPRYLRAGQTVIVRIEGIGALVNPVVKA
jgi:2-keto-4-pentenoate hydratase/2-oxohepta-3-ene-1,7-dioic acid hydratase in catechol pathway